jgi:hypothetical protein
MRLWKVPGALAEYTVGTAIVLFHLGMVARLERRKRKRLPS